MRKIGLVLASALMATAVPTAAIAAGSGTSDANAGCTRFIYNVTTEKPIYDSWSTSSRIVWRTYASDQIESYSVGQTWVRVDNLRQGGAWTPHFNDDYVTKSGLNYVTCD